MDSLKALPVQQKIIMLVVALALGAGGFYYLVMGELASQTTTAEAKQRKFPKEYQQLKEYEEKQRQITALEQKELEEAKLEENKRMLPAEDEIEAFIENIQADARAAGLQVQKFDPLPHEIEDYYKKIPYKVELRGKPQDFVAFLETLAAPKKRIVNVRELEIDRLPINTRSLDHLVGERSERERAELVRRIQKEMRDLTAAERHALEIENWQLANEMNEIQVSFVAYTFSYTGEPMPEELRSRKRRRRRS